MNKIDYATGYYNDVKSIEHYQDFNTREPDYWQMHYGDRWLEIARLLDARKLLDQPTLLDVGCGLGRSLEYFNRYGLKTQGIEPNIEAAAIAQSRGLMVKRGYIGEVKGQFDIIHIEQVLSHSPEAPEIIRYAYSLLNDQGVLAIEEPNDYNVLQLKLRQALGDYWVTDDHVNYYSRESLSELVEKAGFKVEHVSVTYPMELFELAGRHYVGNDVAGASLHQEVTRMLLAMGGAVRKRFLDGFAEQGIGRDLVLYCTKGV